MTPQQYWLGWIVLAAVVVVAQLPLRIALLRVLGRIARALEDD